MGCHTWFYTKLENEPPYEEIQEKVLTYLQENIDINMDNPKFVAVALRQFRMIKKGLCRDATCRWYANWDLENILRFVTGKGFYQAVNEHDIFRIGGYPKDKLFSLEETFLFLDKNRNRITFSPNWEKDLFKFWEKYPNGMIDFG